MIIQTRDFNEFLYNMFKCLLVVSCALASAYGAGELVILQSSSGVKFVGHEELDQSLLKDVFSASLGFTTNKGSSWSGLEIKDPFHYPSALFVTVVDGVRSLSGASGSGGVDSDDDSVVAEAVFPLVTDEDESVSWHALERRIRERYLNAGFGGNLTLVRADLSEGGRPIFDELKAFDDVVTEAVLGAERKGVSGPDAFWVVLRGLRPLIDLNEEEQLAQAEQIITKRVHSVAKELQEVYGDRVLVAVITTDKTHTRHIRSLMADGTQVEKSSLHLSKSYDIYYPAMFNIFLWFMVAFVFAIIAISLAIATMDPGRDSIIYRMTSSSMKKDN